MNSDEEKSNGITPSKAINQMNNKRSRTMFDQVCELNDISFDNVDEVKYLLEIEVQRNKDLTFRIGKMQGQLEDLTKQIEKLTNLMVDLQKEKEELKIEMMQKKSPTKGVKTKKKVSIKPLQFLLKRQSQVNKTHKQQTM